MTEADIAVDRLLRERLTRLVPDVGWLSEESEDDRARLGGARLWIVDPIDGTRAYVNGRTDWAISVALVENGRPVAGAIFAPLEDGLYLAVAGEGATRDGVPIARECGRRVRGRARRRAETDASSASTSPRPASSPSRRCIRSRCAWRASRPAGSTSRSRRRQP